MTKMDWDVLTNRLQKASCHAADIVSACDKTAPPIDPLQIASTERHLLRVRGDDFGKRFDGQLEFHPNHQKFLLLFNTKYDRGLPVGIHHPRTRFSIAHELGHFYLDEHHAFLRKGGSSHPSHSEFTTPLMLEREADAFAAGLLMPEPLIRPLVNDAELDANRIIELSTTFDTSLVSTTIRAVQLSDFPTAVAGMRDGQIAWTFVSDSMCEGGCYPGPRGPIRSKSARDCWMLFQQGALPHTTRNAMASDWFRTFGRAANKPLPVTEYHMPVSTMGTVVVLLVIPEEELFPDSKYD